MTTPSQHILFCLCQHAQILPQEVKEAVWRGLCESGLKFTAVADLCQLAARKDPLLQGLAEHGTLKVAACYPRAVKWLFAAARAPLAQGSTEVLNMRVQSASEVLSRLVTGRLSPNLAGRKANATDAPREVSVPHSTTMANSALTAIGEEPTRNSLHGLNAPETNPLAEAVAPLRTERQAAQPGEWKAWFPVIDYDRCTHCMQCLSFCLFGVFGVNAEQKIEVQNPENCKTNCPACSRVCPEAAIIFPKYKTGPINGDAVREADLARETMKIDISALLGGDIHSVLRERSERAKSRFSKERDANQALQERQRCLAGLVQAADIPPEVLMSLPSPEEIQRKAREAAAKANAALNAQSSSATIPH